MDPPKDSAKERLSVLGRGLYDGSERFFRTLLGTFEGLSTIGRREGGKRDWNPLETVLDELCVDFRTIS